MSGTWLSCPRPRTGADLRLVCVPYAGGGASIYWPWAELLGTRVEMWCAQLPGRERRFGEAALTDIAQVADPLTESIRQYVRPPFVLFGHSMGGLIAFEVARRLGRQGGPAPERVLVSASTAPHLTLPGDPHLLGDADLIGWITHLGGAPVELLANPEMLALLLPTLRADLSACAGYLGAAAKRPIDTPMTAFAGADDPLAAVPDVAAWRRYTTADFALVVRPGGHFYLNDDPSPVITSVLDAATSTAMASTAMEGVL